MLERDIILRWLRSFSEGLLRVVGKVHILEEERKKEFAKLYQTFFDMNRESFLKTEKDGFFEDLFNSDEDLQIRKEKLVALCELIETDLKFEKNEEIKTNLSKRIGMLKDVLNEQYGFEYLDFNRS
ncbi:hypothetical protein MM236_13625 [Belliella sp. DSM 107340]|uniref:Uncharacterized protein n=1 Tax=Belliella calami TaxID=2923436 RepID=A0ABS9URH8_9BACT|nr:hypothetical protein [Belliella calami]MCH7399039.1 hypothetical protein [Belliella calami]